MTVVPTEEVLIARLRNFCIEKPGEPGGIKGEEMKDGETCLKLLLIILAGFFAVGSFLLCLWEVISKFILRGLL